MARIRSVLNPTPTDFAITYDLDGDNVGEEWIAHGLEISDFPEPVALHIAKHLADQILFARDHVNDWAKEHQEVMDELLQPVTEDSWEATFNENRL